MRFNEKKAAGLKPEAKRYEMRDSTPGVRGLALRVSPQGRKTWVLIRWDGRQMRRFTLGVFPEMSVSDAQEESERLNPEISNGHDPIVEKQTKRGELTFGELWVRYRDEYSKPHKKSWRNEQYAYDKHLKRWKNKTLSAISQADVTRMRDLIGRDEGHPYQANRAKAQVRRMFNWINKTEGLMLANPGGTAWEKFTETRRDRALSADELKDLGSVIGASDDQTAADVVRLLLYTGQRLSNVLEMKWSEINFRRGVWTIPKEKTKQGREHRHPLAVQSLRLLARRKVSAKTDWVFHSTRRDSHVKTIRPQFKAFLEAAEIQGVRIHDLRRTHGTALKRCGYPYDLIGTALGHKLPSVTAVYAVVELDVVRPAIQEAVNLMTGETR